MSTNVGQAQSEKAVVRKNRLAIVGISGRMGQEIRDLAKEFELIVNEGVASQSIQSGHILIVSDINSMRDDNVDVVIDFSLPELTHSVTKWCTNHRKPLVSGVTGLSLEQKTAIENAAQTIPVLWAANMSLGIAVLARMLTQFAQLENFDFQIEELHHNKKKDRPSGTALFLQDNLQRALTPDKAVLVPAPCAIRGGGIFGIHRIWAMGEEETITLEHTAMNRRVFARGALKAAQWIVQQAPGLYRMDDVLGASSPAAKP